MKAIVIGFGSIGRRHARILSDLGICTAVISHRNIDFPTAYPDLTTGLLEFGPEYIVVANTTIDHYQTLMDIARSDWRGKVLIEKPLFHEYRQIELPMDLNVYVAYNLRFHPGILKLKTLLDKETLISASIYTGQYLPDWRPDRDYRLSYSANQMAGGGVLRDLSHELDYIQWLFGQWVRLTAIGGQFSSLEITSDDCWGVLLETVRCPVISLQLNYLDRPGRREIIVVTDAHTYRLDLTLGLLSCDGETVEKYKVERDVTYVDQHRSVIERQGMNVCTLQEGIETLQMIEAIESSADRKEWIFNE